MGRTAGVREKADGFSLTTTVGQKDVFEAAMLEDGPRLARIAFFLCGDRTRAEDLVADALAAAWPKWSAGRIDNLVPYLRRAVVNLAAKERRHRLVVFRHEELVAPLAPSPGADESLWARVDLLRLLAALPPAQRVVVVLRYLEDMTEAEMATLLGVSPGTVKSRLARALEAMRSKLEGGDDA
jgi:RNA polymerase sigma-70 factor (sigma-E family)